MHFVSYSLFAAMDIMHASPVTTLEHIFSP